VPKNEIIVLFIHVGHDFLNLMAFHLLKEQFRRVFLVFFPILTILNLWEGFIKGFEPETEKFEKNLENGRFLANRGGKFTEMTSMNSIKTITQLVGRHTSMKQTRTHF